MTKSYMICPDCEIATQEDGYIGPSCENCGSIEPAVRYISVSDAVPEGFKSALLDDEGNLAAWGMWAGTLNLAVKENKRLREERESYEERWATRVRCGGGDHEHDGWCDDGEQEPTSERILVPKKV